MAHDREIIDGRKSGGLRLFHSDHPCPAPSMCKIERGVCQTCKRRNVSPLTMLVSSLARLSLAGASVGVDDYPMAVWAAMSIVVARSNARL